MQTIIAVSLKGSICGRKVIPYSASEEEIKVADFGPEGADQNQYRAILAKKYGKKKQLLSGIHYNFSFSEKFLEILYAKFNQGQSFTEFKNEIYLKVAKHYLKHRWLLLYLTGAGPVIHETFTDDYKGFCKKVDAESYYCPRLISIRNSRAGYKNTEDFYVNYESIEAYIQGIEALIEQGKIYDAGNSTACTFKSGRRPGKLDY